MRYVENVMEAKKDGITVANLRRSDIQKVSTYDYTQYKHEPSKWEESTETTTENLIYFGQSKTYSDTPKYPAMWGTYDSHWTYEYKNGAKSGSDEECETWEREYGYTDINGTQEGNTSTNFKQSYYAHDYKDKKSEFVNETYYDLLFNNPDNGEHLNRTYWLAGRYVHLRESVCDFGLQCVHANSSCCRVYGNYLYLSNRLPR